LKDINVKLILLLSELNTPAQKENVHSAPYTAKQHRVLSQKAAVLCIKRFLLVHWFSKVSHFVSGRNLVESVTQQFDKLKEETKRGIEKSWQEH
jgi:hypothetical protein